MYLYYFFVTNNEERIFFFAFSFSLTYWTFELNKKIFYLKKEPGFTIIFNPSTLI